MSTPFTTPSAGVQLSTLFNEIGLAIEERAKLPGTVVNYQRSANFDLASLATGEILWAINTFLAAPSRWQDWYGLTPTPDCFSGYSAGNPACSVSELYRLAGINASGPSRKTADDIIAHGPIAVGDAVGYTEMISDVQKCLGCLKLSGAYSSASLGSRVITLPDSSRVWRISYCLISYSAMDSTLYSDPSPHLYYYANGYPAVLFGQLPLISYFGGTYWGWIGNIDTSIPESAGSPQIFISRRTQFTNETP